MTRGWSERATRGRAGAGQRGQVLEGLLDVRRHLLVALLEEHEALLPDLVVLHDDTVLVPRPKTGTPLAVLVPRRSVF